MHHTILQQYLHVELNGSESDGIALQRRLPALCRDWVLPALERTLDRYAPEQGSLYIERLEIDAGAISLERLEHDLAESVAQALEKALQEQAPTDTAAAGEHDSGRIQYKTTRHSVAEAFVFFLKTGQLPWSFRLPEDRSLEQVILESWQETEQSSNIQGAEQVRQVLASASARKRLTRQFTPTLLKTLLARLAPAGAETAAMEEILAVLDSDKILSAERRQVGRLLWESVFAKVVAKKPVTAKAIIHDVLPTASMEYSAVAEKLARHWPSDTESSPSFSPPDAEYHRDGKQGDIKTPDTESRTRSETEPPVAAQERPGKNLEPSDSPEPVRHPSPRQEGPVVEEGSAAKPPVDTDNSLIRPERDGVAQEEPSEAVQLPASSSSSGHSPEQHWPATEEGATEKSTPDTEVALVQDSRDTAQERSAEAFSPSPTVSPGQVSAEQNLADSVGEGIYINNAGLVLLHPFLPQFFGALGIAEEEQLLGPERALCLLHFLATGQDIAPEYELMLAKILCNVPLDMPVEADVALTDKELEEAGALLKAVIDHWEALRNTSPDGLRGTFLLRPGKISLRSEDLLLQVEPQTWDILLEQLPWGISMIRLPWMDRMLWVEWT
ncbi:MAG: contractile injection system tape measure protein [Candidatus Electrothrix sp. Rat3]|nr:contractile injection system tape measure protein [Candidatus Electrothrix rattekaaiensis]